MALTNQELALQQRRRGIRPALPAPRGPLTAALFAALLRPAGAPLHVDVAPTDLITGEDDVLALYCLYELHYRGFEGVDESWEWDPALLAVRRSLEAMFEAQIRELAGPVVLGDVEDRLHAIINPPPRPGGAASRSLSAYMATESTLEQLREATVHRSAYQLKEADMHSWALPRLEGAAKAALVEIQADEYGDGVEADMHAELFALTMREMGLDCTYGAYLDVIPAITLATVNLASYFGLHRRWRGRIVGHLAVFEMTSVEPMGRYSLAVRRHGFGPWARLFYETHVVADAHHQTLAARNLAGGLVRDEPHLLGDVLFGAQALSALEARYTQHLFQAWDHGRSSLRTPLLVG